MIISFDYDLTLNKHHILQYIKNILVELKITDELDIYCITARCHNEEVDDEIANGLKVIYTCHDLKVDVINKLNVDIHFDDDIIEIEEINRLTNCLGLLVI